MRLQHVLRRGHQGQAQHRVLGHLVEQGVDRIALARLAREVAGGGRRAQSVGNHDPVRHAVEVPQPLVHVRARLAKEQPLAEIPPAGLFNLALFRLLGIACQGVEAFAVFCLVADQGGVRVEPAQQPVVDAGGIQALGLDAGIGQAADQSVADHVQGLLGRLPSAAAGAAGTAVHHHPHAAALPTPAQPSHDGVLKQAAGLGDGAQVVGKEAQIEVGEARALRTWLDVAPQRLQVLIEVCFVLGIELHYPGVLIQLVEAVLQGVFQRIAGLGEPGGFAPLCAQGRHLEERGHRLAILQQHGLGMRQKLDPGQQGHERRGYVIQGLFVGQRGGTGALHGFARFGQARLP